MMKKLLVVFAVLVVVGGISWLVFSQMSKKDILEIVPESVEEIAVVNGRGISQKLLLNYLNNSDEIMALYKDFDLFNTDSLADQKGKFEDIGVDFLGGLAIFRYPFENREVFSFAMMVNNRDKVEDFILNNEYQKGKKLFDMKQFKIFEWDKFCVALGEEEVYLISFQKSLFMDFGRNIAQMEEANLSKVLAPIIKNKLNEKTSFYTQNESLIVQQEWDLLLMNKKEENALLLYLTLDNGNVNTEVYFPNESKDIELYDVEMGSAILSQFWSWKPSDVADGIQTLLAFQNKSLSDEELEMVSNGLTGKGQFKWLDIRTDTVSKESMEMDPETFELIPVQIKSTELKPVFIASIECVDSNFAFGIKNVIKSKWQEDMEQSIVIEQRNNQLYLYNDTVLNMESAPITEGNYFHKGMMNFKDHHFTKVWDAFKMSRIESEGDIKNDMVHFKATANFEETEINALFLLIHDALLLSNLN